MEIRRINYNSALNKDFNLITVFILIEGSPLILAVVDAS